MDESRRAVVLRCLTRFRKQLAACFGRGRRRRVVKVRVVAALGCLFGVCACSRGAPASCGPHGRLLGVRARRRSRIRGLKCGRLAALRGAAVTPSMTRLVAIFESDFAAARALARGGRLCCLRSPRRVVRRREASPFSKDEQYPQKLLVGFRLGLVTSQASVG